jgi:hypothetical protein
MGVKIPDPPMLFSHQKTVDLYGLQFSIDFINIDLIE